MTKLNYSLKNGGGNLLKVLITVILVGGSRLFHCGDLKLRKNNNLFPRQGAVAFGGLCAELIGNFPSPREEGVGEKVFPFIKIKILKHIIKKCAFTLAEVLITLGIIGVVAAITIPSLVTNYQKHVVETGLININWRALDFFCRLPCGEYQRFWDIINGC